MSRERELLNRCAVTLKARDICPLLLTEISELLAQPEQAVAECTNSDTWNCKYCNKTESCGALKDSRNFAPPTREPLSEDVIWDNMPENPMECSALAFIRGVKFAEKAHGIGEQK